MNTRQMHESEYIQSDESTAAMIMAWIVSIGSYIANALSLANIQTGLVIMTSIVAIIFTFLKIRGQRLDNEIKRMEIESRKRLEMDSDVGIDEEL